MNARTSANANANTVTEPSPPPPWIAAQTSRLLAQRGHAWLLHGPSGLGQYDLAMEMVNMMEATRAYEANVTMMETTKAMISSSLRLIA